MLGEKRLLHIGLRRPPGITDRTFLPVRVLGGLAMGAIAASYGYALVEMVAGLLAGVPGDVATLALLLVGGWALQQMMERMAWREEPVAAAAAPARPADRRA